MRADLLIVLSLYIVAIFADNTCNVEVINNVDPCPGGNYPTISLFLNNGQDILSERTQYDVLPSNIPIYTGIGIQENGEYCRSNGAESGCNNPDNAGMELVMNGGSCTNYVVNGPFYCGAHPPDARNIVNVAMSGNWPNCVATLTRKGGAPGCKYSC